MVENKQGENNEGIPDVINQDTYDPVKTFFRGNLDIIKKKQYR